LQEEKVLNSRFHTLARQIVAHCQRIDENRQAQVEQLDGAKLNSSNPACTQSMVINRLEDMDMSYQLSFVNMYDGLNVQFSAKYETARDIDAGGAIPDAPIRKAGEPAKVITDVSKDFPVLSCSFQEN
jgi:hypothetical protein